MSRKATIEELAQWLKARDDIALMGHLSPDGDAVGSTLALWHALRAMGKRAVVCLPGGTPTLYATLPGADGIVDTEAGDLPFQPQTAMAVDVSENERLGEAGMALSCRALSFIELAQVMAQASASAASLCGISCKPSSRITMCWI